MYIKYLSFNFVVRYFKTVTTVIAVSFLGFGCGEKRSTPENRRSGTKNNKAALRKSVGRDEYMTWKFAQENKDRRYQGHYIYTSQDSIKVFNDDTLICSGEIVHEDGTYESYFKSTRTADQIKAQLKHEFAIKGTNRIQLILNADGDISAKGCPFPFNEMFIADGYLFVYKNGYHAFTSNVNSMLREENDKIVFSGLKLPFQTRTDPTKAKYSSLHVKDITGLSAFACGESEVRYLPLVKTTNIALILVPMDCGDIPYQYHLLSISDHRVASDLYVEGESYEPENTTSPEITSFTISKNSILTVRTINKDFSGKNIEISYTMDKQGRFILHK